MSIIGKGLNGIRRILSPRRVKALAKRYLVFELAKAEHKHKRQIAELRRKTAANRKAKIAELKDKKNAAAAIARQRFRTNAHGGA